MRRATPLGHDHNAPANERETHANPTSPETPTAEAEPQPAHPLSVVRGGAPAERRRASGHHRRRETPARGVVQPSDPERLRRALEAMREMNKLTSRRTAEMHRLSALSRELSEQMQAFGTVIGGLRIGPERRSAG